MAPRKRKNKNTAPHVPEEEGKWVGLKAATKKSENKLFTRRPGITKNRRKSLLNGLKRETIHNVLNTSNNSSFRDSPNSRGMYKRRNRRSGRYFNKVKSQFSQDDCIILPEEPPEVISLLDTDDESASTNNKKRKQPQTPQRNKRQRWDDTKRSQPGPSEASKIRFPETEAFTPFFIDTKKEEDDAPVLQIPLYKPKNDSIICLDDTLTPEKKPKNQVGVAIEAKSSSSSLTKYESVLNESVVIIDERDEKQGDISLEEGEIPADESFIPLDSGQMKKSSASPPKDQKRLVIIDGNNVAMQHGNNKIFSVQGIEIAIKHFEDMGHEVKAIIPQFRMKLHKSTSQVLLEKLHDAGKVLLTPCKNLPGKVSASYDDRFILEVAEKCDGAIISNDNYKDLMNEKPEWHNIITSRVVGFMFCGDKFFVPTDPYGKHGPKLQKILNKSTK